MEISTGYLIGPKYDPRAFYLRASAGAAWQKSCSQPEYRRQVQGRLVGVTMDVVPAAGGAPAQGFDALPSSGLRLVRLVLQGEHHNSFQADGSISAAEKQRLDQILVSAAQQGIAVELVLFHADQDHNFDSPEAMLEAARHLTDWLIDRNHRHVILNPAADWSGQGWDFDSFVPNHLEKISEAIRERFQLRHTDYALPIALSARNRISENSRLVQDADVIIAQGDALGMDPRRVERPVLVEEADAGACAAVLARFSGCLLRGLPDAGTLRAVGPLMLKSYKP
ncbi:hypothetical protein [Paludibaculum fermentans]|uniref:Uncharacterized protein n=1 Tax=Paludibaculum fermentans TaxID=1473598 RepID=A0A7S7SLI1_PALFE|nr:hypothetical protein [Paludibaculum fermentans]QOY90277.1 hypothetical protein IRI77_10070 [Paludibaculum fermentans]